MIKHSTIESTDLRRLIRKGQITLAGNARLKIFGQLGCQSGKRMQRKYRVFFLSEQEAREGGFRPCGHCMPQAYRIWKQIDGR